MTAMQAEEWPQSGVESVQGRRITMEDTHVSFDSVCSSFSHLFSFNNGNCSPIGNDGSFVLPNFSYYGVYDGHGGKRAAELCEQKLLENIIKDSSFTMGQIEDAIRNGFKTTDEHVLKVSKIEGWTSGSTVVLTMIIGNTMYVANAGDAEAILGQRSNNGYRPVLLSKKHKPSDVEEKERIKNAGGHVVFGRVMGSLAVARAIGDRDFKHPYNKAEEDFVSAKPHIQTQELQEEDEFLIVSCDGLWDKMSYEHAVDFVVSCRSAGKSASETAKLLVEESLNRGTLDNVTAIVVFLKEQKQPPVDPDTVLMDVYEFLASETERNKKLPQANSPTSQKDNSKLIKAFNLPAEEQVIEEYSCLLEKKMLHHQGTLWLTENYICFYATLLGKKILTHIHLSTVKSVEREKSQIVVTTNEGKKFIFNWKNQDMTRDHAYTRLQQQLELHSDDQSTPNPIQNAEKTEVVNAETCEPPKDLNWSRFDD